MSTGEPPKAPAQEASEPANEQTSDEKVHVFERMVGEVETHDFKAETRQLLDIVAKSLYQDKEVFIRELVSNASDALEKARYLSASNVGGAADIGTLEVNITVDPIEKLFVMYDNGVGMSSEELKDNLGTIARSGSRAFLKQLEGKPSDDIAKSIIGKFGVGFYRFAAPTFALASLHCV